ncbi:hypothetical protein [Leptospira ilyithenensis]|uniref:Membrane protein 6-pyruvoyl-tetrahydropterin synthase-related domain-containing protein n=1 Tax=Leptospira ilyithenensis TaxID=2484901 RepID=A0A4R9LSX5_9LEPT|nr:hypothetical protein [Leptospira ilyithenensis]TGN14596.1 hypothetical protein EHS11_00985 [Leptospira ilyithenensis]
MGIFMDREKTKRITVYILFTLLLIYRFRSLFYLDDSVSWDGPGHKVLIGIFSKLGRGFLAEGYVKDWFGGFPAFRFYPPAFSFIGSVPHLLGWDLDLSLRFAVIATVIILSLGYIYFVSAFLPKDLAFVSLFLYASFSGSPVLGASFAGIWGGNFPSLLGSGLTYFVLGSWIRYTKGYHSKHLILSLLSLSLLGYTHYLSFLFCYFILLVLFSLQSDSLKRKESWVFIFLPIVLAIPSLYGPIFQGNENLGETLFAYYPFLQTMFGEIEGDSVLKQFLMTPARIIPFLSLIGIFLSFRNLKENGPYIIVFFVFLLMTQDVSFVKFFSFTKIHFYRSWDLFLGIFYLLAIKGSWEYRSVISTKYILYGIGILALVLLGPRSFGSPLSSSTINESVSFLRKNIPPQSNIYTETTVSAPWNRSPHLVLSWTYESDFESDNGLMVESSWTPFVQRLYLPIQNENDFNWGFSDPRADYSLNFPNPELSIRFLQERNIDFLITKTDSFRNNFSFLKEKIPFSEHLSILKITKSKNIGSVKKVIGLVSLAATLGEETANSPKDFFIESFLLAQAPANQSIVYLDINPLWNQMPIAEIQKEVPVIYIYDPKRHIIVDTLEGKQETQACKPTVIPKSYFSSLKSESNRKLYRTQFNQILVCLQNEKSQAVYLPQGLGISKFIGLVLVFSGWIVAFVFSLLNRKNVFKE